MHRVPLVDFDLFKRSKFLPLGWKCHVFDFDLLKRSKSELRLVHCKKKSGHRMANPLFCQYPTILWPFPKLQISCYLYHHPMAISSLRPLYGQKSSDRLIRPPLWPDLIVAINRNTHKNLKITISTYVSPHTVHKKITCYKYRLHRAARYHRLLLRLSFYWQHSWPYRRKPITYLP